MPKKPKMEFIETKNIGEKEWSLLLDALGIRPPFKCRFCKEEVKYPKMGLLPLTEPTIVCSSIVCLTEAIEELKRGWKTKKKVKT